jgi:putative spermidine/putrescine transport system substrate-binding protein
MRAREWVLVPLAVLLMAGGTPPSARPAPADDTLPPPVSAALAGPARDAILRVLLKPYAEATGTVLATPPWDGAAATLQKLLADHAVDLVLLGGTQLADLCRAGALQKLDWPALGRDRFLPGTTSDCGAGAYVSATVLVWDRDKLAGVPGWGDFWDVAKHPGRRGLRRAARGNLEIALLADGVALGNVYQTLRSNDGVDRAFRKLDQLKPYVLWWDEPAQPGQMLAGSKVLLTSAPSNAVPGGPKLKLGVQWAGGLEEVTSWAVPAQPSHPRAAAASLVVATDPARLANFAKATGLGPPTKAAIAMLPADLRPQSPTASTNQQSVLAIDEAFWAENGDKLEARFAAWIGK